MTSLKSRFLPRTTILSREKKLSRFKYNVDYLNIEMISNQKNMNYKVVGLDGIYNFCITFISIRVHMKEIYVFFKKYIVKRKNICVKLLGLKMISNEKCLNYKLGIP